MQILYQNRESGEAHDVTELAASAAWKTARAGSPGSLELTLLDDPAVELTHGSVVALLDGGRGLFYGYVFRITRSEKGETQVLAYDQLRYLKNKETYVFQGQRADQIVSQIAADFGVRTGELDNTGFAIPSLIEDGQTLLDIILKALDLTLVHTGRMYCLWDDFGALRLSDVRGQLLPLLVGDESLATSYQYQSDIDSDTANRIKLVRDNGDSGRREVYVVQDSGAMARWGMLQHYGTVDEGLNAAQIEAQADQLLFLKNRPQKTLSISALSDLSVRAGKGIYVKIGDLGLEGWFLIHECSHDLLKETMTMKLVMS